MSRSEIVRQLRSLAARGVAPGVRELLPRHAGVVAEALASFGSFARARDAAGLDAPPAPRDRDEVVDGLRALHFSGTRIEFSSLLSLGETGLIAAARRHFGSLPAAAAAAGVPMVEASPDRGPAPPVRDVTRGDVGPRRTLDLDAVLASLERASTHVARRASAELVDAVTEAVARFAHQAAVEARRTALRQMQDAVMTVPIELPFAAAPRSASDRSRAPARPSRAPSEATPWGSPMIQEVNAEARPAMPAPAPLATLATLAMIVAESIDPAEADPAETDPDRLAA